ncbi:hypothetical protein RB594_007529 [Gaeumannomyces avenae]
MARKGANRKTRFQKMYARSLEIANAQRPEVLAACAADMRMPEPQPAPEEGNWDASPEAPASDSGPCAPAQLLTVEQLQDHYSKSVGSGEAVLAELTKENADEVDKELICLNERILDARSQQNWASSEALEQERDEIIRVARETEPTRDFNTTKSVFSALKYNPAYHKFSAVAAKGENTADDKLVMTIPFHPKDPATFFKGGIEQPHSGLSKVLRELSIASMILGELTYAEKQSVAIACKETFNSVGRILEVWDTNRFDFLGKDVALIRVGVTDDGRPVEMKASWSDISKVKHQNSLAKHREAHKDLFELTKEDKARNKVCRTLVRDNMMVDVPRDNSERMADKELEPIGRRGHLNVMCTAVRFEATKATRNKSPRLKYSDALEGTNRLLEVLSYHGASIRSLDISGQDFLTWQHVDLILLATPNIRQLTLRDNHLLNVTQTECLMRAVKRRRPDCRLDFYPFYHYGPSYQNDLGDRGRWGSYGLTFEDSGVHTESVVANLIDRVHRWEKDYGVEMLARGLGFRHFLERLPLPVGFVSKVLASHALLDATEGHGSRQENEMAHNRRIYEVLYGQPAPEVRKQFFLTQCCMCNVKVMNTMMNVGVRCSWCSFTIFADMEPHRYQTEKRAVVARILPFWGCIMNSTSLGELFGGMPSVDVSHDDASEEVDQDADEDGNEDDNEDASEDADVDPTAGESSTANDGNEPDAEPQSQPEPEPLLVPLDSDPAANGWTWNPATPAEERCLSGYKMAMRLEWTRLRDIARVQMPKRLRFEATPRFWDRMRMPGWNDRGPGDHEMFPVQRANIFDTGGSDGAFIGLTPDICGVRRPNNAEAMLGTYHPANSMDKMRRLMVLDPAERKKELGSFW